MTTLAILKPGFQDLYEKIKDFLEERSIYIFYVAREITLPMDLVEELYAEHKKKDFFLPNCYYMISGPVTVLELRGIPPQAFRKLLTEEIRPRWGIDVRHNVMHASDDNNAYLRERSLFAHLLERVL